MVEYDSAVQQRLPHRSKELHMSDHADQTQDASTGAPYGYLHEAAGVYSMRFDRSYPVTVVETWRAITQHDQMAQWAFGGHLEARVDGRVRFDTDRPDTALGRVLAWEEPSLLEYQWGGGKDLWRIRFALTSTSDGETSLTFDHFAPEPTNAEFAAGWHWHLDRLAQLLAGVEPADVDEDQHFHDLMEHYAG